MLTLDEYMNLDWELAAISQFNCFLNSTDYTFVVYNQTQSTNIWCTYKCVKIEIIPNIIPAEGLNQESVFITATLESRNFENQSFTVNLEYGGLDSNAYSSDGTAITSYINSSVEYPTVYNMFMTDSSRPDNYTYGSVLVPNVGQSFIESNISHTSNNNNMYYRALRGKFIYIFDGNVMTDYINSSASNYQALDLLNAETLRINTAMKEKRASQDFYFKPGSYVTIIMYGHGRIDKTWSFGENHDLERIVHLNYNEEHDLERIVLKDFEFKHDLERIVEFRLDYKKDFDLERHVVQDYKEEHDLERIVELDYEENHDLERIVKLKGSFEEDFDLERHVVISLDDEENSLRYGDRKVDFDLERRVIITLDDEKYSPRYGDKKLEFDLERIIKLERGFNVKFDLQREVILTYNDLIYKHLDDHVQFDLERWVVIPFDDEKDSPNYGDRKVNFDLVRLVMDSKTRLAFDLQREVILKDYYLEWILTRMIKNGLHIWAIVTDNDVIKNEYIFNKLNPLFIQDKGNQEEDNNEEDNNTDDNN